VRSAVGVHLAAKIGAGATFVAALLLAVPATAGAGLLAPTLPAPTLPVPTLPVPTLPPVQVALPPVQVALPPVKVALPPVKVALPPVQVALPPVEVALPPVQVALPPVHVALPPLQVPLPPENVGQLPPDVALPPVSVASPPGDAVAGPTGSTPAGSPAVGGGPAGGSPLEDTRRGDARPGAVASVRSLSAPASGAVAGRNGARAHPSRHDKDSSGESRGDAPSGFLAGGPFGVDYSVISVAELVAILVAFVAVGFLVTQVLATLRARGVETSLRRAPGSS
jgi:hypothetical protein